MYPKKKLTSYYYNAYIINQKIIKKLNFWSILILI